jgi:hypothetical protein
MSAWAKSVGGATPAHTYVFKGRTYTLRTVDIDAEVEIQKNLYRVRTNALAEQRSAFDPEDYKQRLDKIRFKYEAGDYAIDAPEGMLYYIGEPANENDSPEVKQRKIRRAMPGQLWFASYIFGCDIKTMLDMWQTDQAEVMSLIELVLTEAGVSSKAESNGTPDPNARAAQTTAV